MKPQPPQSGQTANPALTAAGRDRRPWVPLAFLALFASLILLYHPSFSNPPRSDYWPAFYFFQLVDASSESPHWYHVFTYDPWSHGTFRPFSFFLLYIEHHLFGSNFLGPHLTNFFMYFLTLILLYRLAVHFQLDRGLALAFISVLAFLFSHFDIIIWTFHIYSLAAFAAVLGAFNFHLSFLKTGRRVRLALAALLFLVAVLTYEVFIFWPLAILLLSFSPELVPLHPSLSRRRLIVSCGLVLAVVYAGCIGAFAVSKAIGSYQVGPLLGTRIPISPGRLLVSAASVFFNLIYVGVLVNLAPTIAVPAIVQDNLDMGGLLLNWARQLRTIVPWVGAGVVVGLAACGRSLLRRGRRRPFFLLLFFLYLLFTFFFIVATGRSKTNPLIYTFAQFRYQYTANALTLMMAAGAVDTLLRPSRREKFIVFGALIPLLVSNIYVTSTYVAIVKSQLAPLYALLTNIKTGIREGLINERNKLYIEDGITGNLPPLCWNDDMAIFMRGTYEWIFPREEIRYFTFTRQNAAWIIPEDDYRRVLSREEADQHNY